MALDKIIVRDEAVSQRVAGYANNRMVRSAAWLTARTGDSIFWLLVSLILIQMNWAGGWVLLSTVIFTGLLTAVTKRFFKRERPISKWTIAADIYSFPSGHAARAGAVAVTLVFILPQYAILWALWAPLVALARVLLSRHYIADVSGGLLFGISIGILLQFLLRYYS
jgi:membrane-associated phospholipid phosphatase